MSAPAHKARKRFGQNFLTDTAIIDAIVRAIAPCAGDRMVEIGPGLAALTQPLVERVGRLAVIELDRDLAVRLRQHPHLHVIESDVLAVDFAKLAANWPFPAPGDLARNATDSIAKLSIPTRAVDRFDSDTSSRLRIVGNLPYNISSPILFHLLPFAHLVVDQHFMLQKEVVDRMVASPDHPDFGRLSVMLQWRYDMESVLHVPPESFDPAPKVDSAIVRMVPRATPVALDAGLLEDLMRAAFSQRRKLLRHSLGPWLAQRLAQHPVAGDITFDLQRRAQEVPVDEYLALAQRLSQPQA